jgi:hypothetical protein
MSDDLAESNLQGMNSVANESSNITEQKPLQMESIG